MAALMMSQIMDPEDEPQSVESLVRLLAEDHLTSSEVYFLLRRLSFKTDAEAWVMLHAYYGHPPEVLREVERRILQRVSSDGLAQVEAYLETLAPDAPDSELSLSEYANLRAVVERAVELQIKNRLLRQARPNPAVMLAADE
ncbi:MAG: hypothetical protein JNL42_12880, partial [Anaerolineae bacterium]|nr:hypothetical protein [Anaerolineae bacterium]